jgi:rhodanese-related sulfurtransferase
MRKNNIIRYALYILAVCLILQVPGYGESKVPLHKQTSLGLYVTAKEAYAKWQADPANVKVVDVRTPEEYMYVGHPPMAHNIPYLFLMDKWYTQSGRSAMIPNTAFAAQVKKKFKPTDTLLLICRSGGRSAMAVDALASAGFKKVYTVFDGFEGDKVKDEKSPLNGKRAVNGWKIAGAPWTYSIKPELAYSSVHN